MKALFKTISPFLLAFAALATSAATPADLVSSWRADGNAQDAMGTNHGTLIGGAGFTAGVSGQAFLLDGIDDFIRIPDSASLHLAGELTVEMWFKREDASSYGVLMDKRDWFTCNYGVIMSSDWGFQLYCSDGSYKISHSPVPSPGTFHHLAGTYRQTDPSHVELKTYVDGQLVASDNFSGNLAATFNSQNLTIGVGRDGEGGSFFRGVIDEVSLYRKALSLSEIQSNYLAFSTNVPPPPPPPTNSGGLLALWRADGDGQDSIGVNHGALMGGVGFAPGVSGQGFLLDGSDDYVRVLDHPSLHLASEFTVEMWFKREDASSYGALFDKRNWTTCNYGVIMSGDWGFQLYYNDPSVYQGNLFEISFSPVPSPGVFHHLAGTFRQADAGHVELKTYIDGQLVQADTLNGNLGNTFNADALAIGTARDGQGGGNFRGVIDEVALYGRALTASEVLSNYTALATNLPPPPPPPPPPTNSAGLVAQWHADGDAQDSVGSNHGTLVGSAGFGAGVSGQGFVLDGQGSFIRIPDSASLHLSGELTVEMWFKRNDASSYGALIDKRNWVNCNFGVIMSADWGFQVYYEDPNVNQGHGYEISFSAVPAPGVFHHFAGTYRQVDPGHVELKTYIDGQLTRTDTLGGNLATTFNNDALAIGTARNGLGGSFFNGVIDEVALYGRALTASEVFSNYTAIVTNLPPPPPPPPPSTNSGGLIALWHAEGNGQDSAGNNHGSLHGGLNFAPGVVGQGFVLDGVNDYIRIPDSAALDLANEFTMEMWFKREDAGSYGVLMDKRNWTSCNYGVIMSADWGFQVYYDDPTVAGLHQYEISFSGVPGAGIFHHFAGTFRQTDATHVEVRTYIDGQLIRADVLPGNLAATFNGDALAIGAARDGADGFFRGVIDEVALHGRALSAAEVLSNYVTIATLPQIISQPQSLAVVQGDPATLTVSAVGAPPLRYQWSRSGNDLAGETNSSLAFGGAQFADGGDYVVVVANDSGSVTSVVASLTVSDTGLPPSFLTQPTSVNSTPVGGTVILSATVAGTPPFAFTWTFDGVVIPGAVQSSLILSNVQTENAGTYQLVVSNEWGYATSTVSTLNVNQGGGGGTLIFNNTAANLVYDVGGLDGVPSGEGYLAALYVGSQASNLTQVGGTAGFIAPGRFFGGTRSVSFMAPGQIAQVQVRVWDSKVSSTYEEAVALGAVHGASPVFAHLLAGGVTPPYTLSSMPGFSLQPGTGAEARRGLKLADAVPIQLSKISRSGHTASFVLSGAAGATFAIESSSNLADWTTLGHVVNNSGAVRFVDPNAPAGETRFYRARLINP